MTNMFLTYLIYKFEMCLIDVPEPLWKMFDWSLKSDGGQASLSFEQEPPFKHAPTLFSAGILDQIKTFLQHIGV